ncbi:extracellular solute-binding protein [Microbacterium sp. GXS0129]|uniref:extracellular solute-binding protein n=1 Tax=Microbacterium sp. GXS0129 TaxID=3377836 RepID=UPI00383B9761
MNRKFVAAAGLATVAALTLAGCAGGDSGNTGSTGGSGESTEGSSGKSVALTMSAWNISSTPEFQTLVDGFEAANPGITIELKEYDAAEYNTLITTDLAAGSGPDIITQKEVKYLTTFQEGGQLADVSDVELPDGISGAESYKVDGTAYATPYRNDSWVLFYNKALFEQAGVATPDGTWTWDDYQKAADELNKGLTAAGSSAKAVYQHRWQSTVQGFANAQTKGADILEGKIDQFGPYYDRTLAMQSSGDQIDFNTSSANQLTYQGEFGKQNAAMELMGTWFVATLIAQQASGDADAFEWGIAPAPQADSSTAGLDKTPVTFGDPTGFGVNANADAEKQAAAKKFLAYAASEEAAVSLAKIGITPALVNDTVVDTYFAAEGAPTDDLSKFAFSTHKVVAENPTSPKTAAIQGVLNDMHSAILSGSTTVEKGLAEAKDRLKNEVGVG